MPSPSSRYPALVLRPSLLKLGALAVLTGTAPALRAQGPPPGLGCGDRPPGEYAVVLDASSSLLRNRMARQTEESYVDVLERVAGLLCRGERMLVYPMARNESTRLFPVDSVLPAEASRARLRRVAEKALEDDPSHSDFLLAVNRMRIDVLSRPGMRAVFFLTDGSFYPHPVPAARDQRLETVKDRLTDLATVARQLRDAGAPFFVVGIRAGHADAVDPELAFSWPDSAGRAWFHGGRTRDLRRVNGDTLLAALFEEAYVPGDRLNLWDLLIGGSQSPWQRGLGYSGAWTRVRPLGDLRALRMEHLVFVPPDGADPASCARVRDGPRPAGAPLPVQPVRVGAGHYVCSLERPTAAEIDSIAAPTVRLYSFRQLPRFQPAHDPAPLYGLHEFILSVDTTPCPEWTVSRDFLQSRGPPGGPSVGRLELVPVAGARTNDTVSMVKKSASPCIVPNLALDTVSRRNGEYLLFVTDTGGEWVHQRKFEPPRLRLASLDFRPGGFPFPPGRLALLGVCVHSTTAMRPGEKLVVELDTAMHELKHATREDCPAPAAGAQRPYVYGFRGVVLLDDTDLRSARVGIAPGGQSASIPHRGGWLPVRLTRNGTWFLSHGWLAASALLGALIQMGYLGLFAGVKWRNLRRMRRLLSLSLSVVISAMLVVVFAECVVMVTQSPIAASSIPIPFGLVVLGHALKLLAAALVPELVEDTLLNDG